MKPTLYYAPVTCALASHIVLEEVGADVDYVRISLSKGEQRTPAYLKLNPKGRVPTMVTEHGALTESPAILEWIVRTWPRANLAPLNDLWALAQISSFNIYLAGTVHAIGFRGVFKPETFVDGEAAQMAVKARALAVLREAFSLMEGKLAGSPWIHGEAYTTSDPYLAVLFNWLKSVDLDLRQFPRLAEHYARVFARPAAQRAAAAEKPPHRSQSQSVAAR